MALWKEIIQEKLIFRRYSKFYGLFTRNMVDGLGLLTTLFDVGVTVEKLLFYQKKKQNKAIGIELKLEYCTIFGE